MVADHQGGWHQGRVKRFDATLIPGRRAAPGTRWQTELYLMRE